MLCIYISSRSIINIKSSTNSSRESRTLMAKPQIRKSSTQQFHSRIMELVHAINNVGYIETRQSKNNHQFARISKKKFGINQTLKNPNPNSKKKLELNQEIKCNTYLQCVGTEKITPKLYQDQVMKLWRRDEKRGGETKK